MRRSLLLVLTGVSLSACAGMDPGRDSALDPPSIGTERDDLMIGPPPPESPDAVDISLYDPDRDGAEVNKLRSDALTEAGQSYGSQMGYARRSWEIAGRLQARSSELSDVFDFNRVTSTAPAGAGVVVPPVVSRSFDAFLSDAEGREVSVADEYLTIVAPGRISPVSPTWHEYLLVKADVPDEPTRALRPTDPAEKEVFLSAFNEGWEAGSGLAESELNDRLSRLRRDYEGMLQYRRLVAKGMMDRMVLADADFGVTEEEDEDVMRIGSRTVRIVSDAEFQSDPSRWHVRSVSERDREIVSSGIIPPMDEIPAADPPTPPILK